MKLPVALHTATLLTLLLGSLGSEAAGQDPANQRQATVGMRARIEQLVLPGSELVAKPADDLDAPMMLRVVGTYPHGTDFRYDLEYYGLEPGVYDLRDFLMRKDASPLGDLKPIPVEVLTVLPAGQIRPKPLKTERPPSMGGYRTMVAIAAVVWVLGLLAILLVGRRRKAATRVAVARQTLADRLRPIVEAASRAEINEHDKAELERLLLAYWRKRLGLTETKVATALATLRDHPDAGELLRQLEQWLHQPEPPKDVDVGALLAPYRNVPAHIVEEPMTAEAS